MPFPDFDSASGPTSPGGMGGGAGPGGILAMLQGLGWKGAGWGVGGAGLLYSLMRAAKERGDYHRRQQLIDSLMNPENIYKGGVQDFNRTIQGPGFQQARSEIFGAGQGLENNIMQNSARAGLNMSGIGIAARAGAHSTIGSNLGRLTADAWQRSLERSGNYAFRRAGVMNDMPRQNDWGQLSGVGLNALLSYLMKRGGVQWQNAG